MISCGTKGRGLRFAVEWWMKPQRFGRYELLEEMGRGGMATILLARLVGPSDFQKHLVIKRIHDHLTTDAETVNRFMDEARLAARIHHPNVVQLFEFDEVDSTYFIAMEYVHGENLADLYNHVRADSSGGYHWGHAVRVIAEAASGLHAAHELVGGDGESLRIVHRDVSPQNIMVSYDGHVKVADFGIAHAVGRHHNTVDGTVMGKVAYMSPEQCRGATLDRRTDVFALGIVLYEMVCLRRLFRASSDRETMRRVLQCEFTPPRQARPDLPVGLEQILFKALAVRPEERYQTAAELQYALDGLLAAERAMITASSCAAFMAVVFQKEKLVKDRRIQKIYSQTFMEPPQPRSPEVSGLPQPVENEWDAGATDTRRDTAPPPVAGPERRSRTVRGFGTPSGKPIVTAEQWDDAAPTVIDNSRQDPVRQPEPGAGVDSPFAPVVWPSNDREDSGPTQPVGPARRVQNLGPTVDLGVAKGQGDGVDRGASPGPTPRGAVQMAPAPLSSGAGPFPAAQSKWPSNRHVGEIGDSGESNGGSVSVRADSARSGAGEQPSSHSVMVKLIKRSAFKMLLVGIGVAVALGVIVGLTLTHLGGRSKSAKNQSGTPSSTKKRGMITLRFKVSPPGAKLTIDGREYPAPEAGGERVVQVPWQEIPLVVKVTAVGYQAEQRSVTPAKDQILEIGLTRQGASTRPISNMAPMGMDTGMEARPSPRPRSLRRPSSRRRSSLTGRPKGYGEGTVSPFGNGVPMRRSRVRTRPMRSDLKSPWDTSRSMRGGGANADDI
jgi:eukaryotic-like serine/threonine-protein kinase